MKVLILNTTDKGGAALAAYDIHRNLLKNNIKSTFLVRYKHTDREDITEFVPQNNIINKIKRYVRRLYLRFIYNDTSGSRLFSSEKSDITYEIYPILKQYDVILLNWIVGFIDYKSFFDFVKKQNIPVIWRLADLNPFTGGCHYSYECEKFKKKCMLCNQLSSTRKKDLSYKIFTNKEKIFSYLPENLLRIVSISKWEYELAKNSKLIKKFRHSIIHNGVDMNIFFKKEKSIAKQFLRLPSNKIIFLLVADKLNIEYKGIKILSAALEKIKEKDKIFIITVGNGSSLTNKDIAIKKFGFIQNRLFLSLIYSAADYFIFPSLYETFGKTFLEALACGTPVVGFNAGGADELIINDYNGYISSQKNANELYQLLNLAIDNFFKIDILAKNAENTAKNYSLDKQTQLYIKLFNEILDYE